MTSRLILSIMGFVTLAACQNSKMPQSGGAQESVKTTTSPKVSDAATNPPSGEPRSKPNAEPEMSVGLPPDREAIEISKKEQQNSAMKNTAGTIYLKEGENKFLKEYEMNITFKRMTEDSRCPKDVNCIWAGVATAEVELMGLYTRPVLLKLSTANDVKKGYTMSQEFNGNTITLLEVTPETTSDKGLKALQGTYRIRLKVTKGSAGGAAQTTGTTTR